MPPITIPIRLLILLLSLCVLTGCSSGQSPHSEESSRPNIIIMYSDDHTAQAVGAYNGVLDYGLQLNHTPTPHIDKLAANGMRFDNAFVSNSICKPSRAAFLTGMHSHKNGVFTNADSISTDLRTFPVLLQEAGYQTAMIGKWHLVTEPQGFDYYEVLYGQGPYYNPTMRTSSGDTTYHGHTSNIITNSTLGWLQHKRNAEQPFMLIYNHKAPHRNWLPGPDHLGDYRDRDLPEPPSLFYNYSGLTEAARQQEMEIGSDLTWGWDLKLWTHPETGDSLRGWNSIVNRNNLTAAQEQRIKQAYAKENAAFIEQYPSMSQKQRLQWRYQRYVKDYLRVIRGIDDGVGRLMDYLKQQNMLDNTVIVYAGDQGFFLGENGWFDKRWIYEESMRMPLIVHWPEGIEPKSVNKNLVQNIDLAPTILQLAGAQIPDRMQGKSMMPLLQGQSPDDWRKALYYHYYEGPPRVHKVAKHYGIRTQRYTMAHFYENADWELFDLQKDPEQLQSVYGDAEYQAEQQRLKKVLNDMEVKYGVRDSVDTGQ